MLEEQRTRIEGSAPTTGTEETSATRPGAAAEPLVPAAAPRVEGVPSEQLWRAAVLAARQAALAAADLRRALAEASATLPPVAPAADDVAGASLVG